MSELFIWNNVMVMQRIVREENWTWTYDIDQATTHQTDLILPLKVGQKLQCIYKTSQHIKRVKMSNKIGAKINIQMSLWNKNHKQLWIYGWSVYTVPDCKIGSVTNIVSSKGSKKGREREREVSR